MVWIYRSETSDIPLIPMARCGRQLVWNTCRGNHLGQRPCADAPKGRTYGRKRLDQITVTALQGGGRPHMVLVVWFCILEAPPVERLAAVLC